MATLFDLADGDKLIAAPTSAVMNSEGIFLVSKFTLPFLKI
jgi:hypothetical protein